MEVSIRQIATTDPAYQDMLRLRDEVLRKPLGMSVYEDDLTADKDDIMLIALQDKTAIGCVMMKPIGNGRGKMRQMAVAAAAQSKGIGRQLVLALEGAALAQGIHILELHARKTAVHFYTSLGYQASGDEFEEVGIPHLFMSKTIHAHV